MPLVKSLQARCGWASCPSSRAAITLALVARSACIDVNRNRSEVLFRTAEYLASGYFHNSQVIAVNHAKKTVTFRYKSRLDVRTKEKSYNTVTMDIYEFMAKMLYFLPKKHQKMIRYYGIYAHGAGEKLKKIQNATWKAAIEHSFDTDPEKCLDCGAEMHPSVVYGYNAEQVWYRMRREYCLYKGYFRPMKRGP